MFDAMICGKKLTAEQHDTFSQLAPLALVYFILSRKFVINLLDYTDRAVLPQSFISVLKSVFTNLYGCDSLGPSDTLRSQWLKPDPCLDF